MSLLGYFKDQRAHGLAKAFKPVFVRYDAETATETLFHRYGEDLTLPDRYRWSRTVTREEALIYSLVTMCAGNLAQEPDWTLEHNRPQWGYFATIGAHHLGSGRRYLWSDEFPHLRSPIKDPIALDPARRAVFYFPERLLPCHFLRDPAAVMAAAAYFDEGWRQVELPVSPTAADTWGCDEPAAGRPYMYHGRRILRHTPLPAACINDQVQLRLNERLFDVRITGQEDDRFTGRIEALPPRSKTRLKGLEPGQSLTFRYAHIFSFGSSQLERSGDQ